MTTWLNASFEMRFRLIGALTVRFAASQDHRDHALLLSPWPESLLAFEPVWWRLAQRTHLVAVDLPGLGRGGGACGRFPRWPPAPGGPVRECFHADGRQSPEPDATPLRHIADQG